MGETYKLVRVDDNNSFIKRHSKVISFIGALIVFTTYIVKEGFLDEAKSLTTAVDQAQTTYALRSEFTATQAQITQVDRRIDTLSNRVEKQSVSSMKEFGLKMVNLLTDKDRYIVRVGTLSMDNAKRLMTKLPNNPAEKSRLQSIRDVIGVVSRRIGDFNKLSVAVSEHNDSLTQTLEAALKIDNAKEQVARNKLGQPLEVAINSLTNEVLERAETERAKDERLEKTWKKLGYGLYALGWGLGLLGKFSGGGDLLGGD